MALRFVVVLIVGITEWKETGVIIHRVIHSASEKNMKSCKNRGFTLIELIASVLIISLVAVVSVGSYRKFEAREAVELTAGELVAALGLARQKTLSVEKPAGCVVLEYWEIVWTSNDYAIQAWCDGGYLGQNQLGVILDDVILTPASGGVRFMPPKGEAVAGLVSVTSPQVSDKTITITVSAWGKITVE